ncbi:MAG: YbaK/EbsC family protein [Betaproteobacteria bacterium]|nr:YbaK/EbsC family protein [Betaproteobacteria bacterium]
MNIARNLQDYLATQQIAYEVIGHSRTVNSSSTAQAAHVPGASVAKGVVVKDKAGYVMAVLPASHHVALSQLGAALRRDSLELASESELTNLFCDCAVGAVPPLGAAYGLPMIVEEALAEQPDVFFEAGDHEHVIHVTRNEFMRLIEGTPRAHFGEPGATGGGLWMQ